MLFRNCVTAAAKHTRDKDSRATLHAIFIEVFNLFVKKGNKTSASYSAYEVKTKLCLFERP